MNNQQHCSRADDLVGWLYGEATDSEAQSFQEHLKSCVSCTREVESFSGIRRSIQEWRNETLGAFDGLGARATQPKPSARAAIKQFFDLSPLWLKGGLAVATVALIVLATVAVFQMQTTSGTAVAEQGQFYTNEQLASLVERKVNEKLAVQQSETSPEDKRERPQANDQPVRSAPRRVSRPQLAESRRDTRRPLSWAERQQLAADLRLVSEADSLDLELIDDELNQLYE